MLALYRIPTNNYKGRPNIPNTSLDDNSHREYELKRPQLTSNNIKRTPEIELGKPISNQIDANSMSLSAKKLKIRKSKLKGCGNIENSS